PATLGSRAWPVITIHIELSRSPEPRHADGRRYDLRRRARGRWAHHPAIALVVNAPSRSSSSRHRATAPSTYPATFLSPHRAALLSRHRATLRPRRRSGGAVEVSSVRRGWACRRAGGG